MSERFEPREDAADQDVLLGSPLAWETLVIVVSHQARARAWRKEHCTECTQCAGQRILCSRERCQCTNQSFSKAVFEPSFKKHRMF